MEASAKRISKKRKNKNIENKDRTNKQNKKRSPLQGLIRMLIIIFIAYLLISFIGGFFKAYSLKKDIKYLNTEVESLEKVNQGLLKETKYFQSPEAIEKIAREKLGLIKQGEVIVMPSKVKKD